MALSAGPIANISVMHSVMLYVASPAHSVPRGLFCSVDSGQRRPRAGFIAKATSLDNEESIHSELCSAR